MGWFKWFILWAKIFFRGGRNEVNVSVNDNDSMTNSDYVNWVDYGGDFDGNLMVLPDMNNLLTDDLSTLSPNMSDFLADDVSTLSPASPFFEDAAHNNSLFNARLYNSYFSSNSLDRNYLPPRQLFSTDTPTETVVGNNFTVPPTPIPIQWTPEDLEYEMEDALQNESEVAIVQEQQTMAVRMSDIAGVDPVIDEAFGQNIPGRNAIYDDGGVALYATNALIPSTPAANMERDIFIFGSSSENNSQAKTPIKMANFVKEKNLKLIKLNKSGNKPKITHAENHPGATLNKWYNNVGRKRNTADVEIIQNNEYPELIHDRGRRRVYIGYNGSHFPGVATK